jgi:hypothetical protein
MTTQTAAAPTTRTDQQVPLQLKLAAAWASFMCLYIYVDVLGLYKPGAVEGILKGKVFTFDITQTFMVSCAGSLSGPDDDDPALDNPAQRAPIARRTSSWPPCSSPGWRSTWSAGSGWSTTASDSPRADPPRAHPALGLDLAPHAGDP